MLGGVRGDGGGDVGGVGGGDGGGGDRGGSGGREGGESQEGASNAAPAKIKLRPVFGLGTVVSMVTIIVNSGVFENEAIAVRFDC